MLGTPFFLLSMGATQKWVQDGVELRLHLAVPPPGSARTWPAGLLGLGHGCHALPHLGLLGLGLEDDGRGCVQQLTLGTGSWCCS